MSAPAHAMPETITELDPLLVAEMAPPCEAFYYLDVWGRRLWSIGPPGAVVLGQVESACRHAAEFVMTIASMPCPCGRDVPSHFLLCRAHTVLPGRLVRCTACSAQTVVLSIEPI